MRRSEDAVPELGHGQLLGEFARNRRAELRLSQEQLAERMGIEYEANWVTHLETGRKRTLPPQPALGRLADALEVDVIDLLRAAGVIATGEPAAREEDPNVSILLSRIRGMDAGELAGMLAFSQLLLNQRATRKTDEAPP